MADPYNFQDPRATKRRSVGTSAPFNDFSTPRELASAVLGTPAPFNDFSTPREFGAVRNPVSAVPGTPMPFSDTRVPWEGTVAGLPWKGTIAQNVASVVPGTPALSAPVQTKRPAPAAALPGTLDTLTGRNGMTRRVNVSQDERDAGAAADVAAKALPKPVVAAPSFAAENRGMMRRSLDQARGNTFTTRSDAAQAINPLSAQGELARRLEISQGGFKGSPSARKAMADYYLGQLGAFNTASDRGQAAGNTAALQGAGDEAAANEAFAARRLNADTFNVEAGLAAEGMRRKGQLTPKDLLDLQITNASALRDADQYELERQGFANKYDDAVVEGYVAQGMTPEDARQRVMTDRVTAGEDPRGSRTSAVAYDAQLRELEEQLNRTGLGEWLRSALSGEPRIPFTKGQIPPGGLRDLSQVEIEPAGGLGRFTGDYVLRARTPEGEEISTVSRNRDRDRELLRMKRRLDEWSAP